jgi:alpha-ketoglutarate-dependent taurine dioxygenase
MTDRPFPYIWRAPAATADIGQHLAAKNENVDTLLHEHGAILFKDFRVDTMERFQRCIESQSVAFGSYVDGNSPRTKLTESIYTSTEHPPEETISMHNELSYAHQWPTRLYFCCVVAPASGGSTLIADSRAILRKIPPAVVDLFERKGITYIRNLHGKSGAMLGKSWQDTFETDAKSDVEAYCRVSGIKYEWRPGNSLRLIQTRPATAVHPSTGDKVWFNQAEQFHPSTNAPDVYEALKEIYGDSPLDMPQNACFGDGSPIPVDLITQIRTLMADEAVAFPWATGDLMIIDNMLTAHGRSPFQGPRKILVAMSGSCTWKE